MAITPEQMYDSLENLAQTMLEDLQEHKCKSVHEYGRQLTEIRAVVLDSPAEEQEPKQQEAKEVHLHINNSEFINCLNRTKQKMTDIEEKHSKDFIASQDLLQRTMLCVHDTVHDYIDEKLKHS